MAREPVTLAGKCRNADQITRLKILLDFTLKALYAAKQDRDKAALLGRAHRLVNDLAVLEAAKAVDDEIAELVDDDGLGTPFTQEDIDGIGGDWGDIESFPTRAELAALPRGGQERNFRELIPRLVDYDAAHSSD